MQSNTPCKILIFTKTAGFRHESIPAGIEALEKFTAASGSVTCDASEDASIINSSNLANYQVLVFLHTSGNFLEGAQLDALKAYVRNGGGFVGIHCAAAGMPQDPWYGSLVGAHFADHPVPQDGVVKIEGAEHVLTKALPAEWKWHDEWYNFRVNPRENVHVLMSIDEGCYEGGSMGNDHPLAWCQEFEGGRSFYTSLGHFSEAWDDNRFLQHVTRGIYWAAGQL
ncbi:putative Glycosyl hydrolase [Seiridium cardinale]|uniref:Glycosyl hydrolase n=1 Tax=Seiridium cardinale TaxID=138064 RepID=A0ABR2XR46_9PEZI